MKKLILITLTIFCLNSVVVAEQLSVYDVIEIGLEKSYDLLSQDLYLKSAKQNLYSSYLDLLPGVNYSISRNETSDNLVSKNGSIDISESVSSNDGRYFSIKNNHYSYKKSKLDLRATKRNLIFDIITAYIDVLEKKENLTLARQNVKNAKLEFLQTKVLKGNGKASRLDLQQSKISLSQVKLDSLKAFDNFVNSKIELCHKINVNYDSDFIFKDISYDFNLSAPVDFRPEQVLSVKSARQDLKQSKLNLLQNTLDFFPTFSFSVNKSFAWEKTSPFQFDSNQPYSFTLQLSYPLMNILLNSPSQKVSQNNLKIQRLNLEQTKQQKQKDYVFYNTSFKQAKRALELARQQIELTELQYDLVKDKYKLGQADLTDLENARSDLFNSKFNKVTKYYELMILQENINLLTNSNLLGKY